MFQPAFGAAFLFCPLTRRLRRFAAVPATESVALIVPKPIDRPVCQGYNNLIYSKMLGGHPMNLFCAALTAAPVTGDNSIVPIAIIAMAVVVVIAAVLLITSRKR